MEVVSVVVEVVRVVEVKVVKVVVVEVLRVVGDKGCYLDQCTGFYHSGVPILVKMAPKENVFSQSAREQPWVLRGVGDPPPHLQRSTQWLLLSQETLK